MPLLNAWAPQRATSRKVAFPSIGPEQSRGRHFAVSSPTRIVEEQLLDDDVLSYFNRKLFVTTVTLESAMAADASMGESSPSAATGMPITL